MAELKQLKQPRGGDMKWIFWFAVFMTIFVAWLAFQIEGAHAPVGIERSVWPPGPTTNVPTNYPTSDWQTRTPFVLTNGTCADDWTAVGAWTHAALAPHARQLTMLRKTGAGDCGQSDAARPLGKLLPESEAAWEACKPAPADLAKGDAYYLRADLSAFGDAAALRAQVSPATCFVFPGGAEADHTTVVHALKSGVVAGTAYSEENDFVTVVEGRLLFEFWSPQSFPFMGVLPSVHPRARHATRTTSVAAVAQIVVEAGETIYVPPFWFVRMTALAEATAVGTQSRSTVQELLKTLNTAAATFSEGASAEDKMRLMAQYARGILGSDLGHLTEVLQHQYVAVPGLQQKSLIVSDVRKVCKGPAPGRAGVQSAIEAAQRVLARVVDPFVLRVVKIAHIEEYVATHLGAEASLGFFEGCLVGRS